MALSSIQLAQLRKIANAHDHDPAHADAAKFALVKPASVSALVKAGYIVVNTTAPASANGEHPARATAEGIAYIAAQDAAPTSTVKPIFKLVAGLVQPEAKRGNHGAGRTSVYPFAQMSPGVSFFIPAEGAETAADVAKRIASSVSSVNKRHVIASRAVMQADGFTPVLERGKPKQEHRYGRHYSVRPCVDGAAYGTEYAGKQGATVWEDVIPA